MSIPLFDRSGLKLLPIASRKNDLDISSLLPLKKAPEDPSNDSLQAVAKKILAARNSKRPVILMMGGHVIRAGVQEFLIDLMKRNLITAISMNGSGVIHDFEMAMIGATTECVEKYLEDGQFGLWQETSILNDIIHEAFEQNRNSSYGEAVGKWIANSDFTFKGKSILASAVKYGVPVTVHVGIGYDIIHEHPNCDGAATGALSYNDFLLFASILEELDGGVLMNFGSAVMAPEVFLKALAMVRNKMKGMGKEIEGFTTLVCDLHALPENLDAEPPRDNPSYYFRPLKTMLIRSVKRAGKSYYVRGGHRETIPELWKWLMMLNEKKN